MGQIPLLKIEPAKSAVFSLDFPFEPTPKRVASKKDPAICGHVVPVRPSCATASAASSAGGFRFNQPQRALQTKTHTQMGLSVCRLLLLALLIVPYIPYFSNTKSSYHHLTFPTRVAQPRRSSGYVLVFLASDRLSRSSELGCTTCASTLRALAATPTRRQIRHVADCSLWAGLVLVD